MQAKVDPHNGTTKEQRKMACAVAADVLLQLAKRSMIVDCGSYLSHPKRGTLWNTGIQEAPKSVLKECRVCAKGAMFISRALLFNEYKFSDDPERCSRRDFGNDNADLIERAFELYGKDEVPDSIFGTAYSFAKRYRTPRARLKAIMENVIANKGVFRPDKDPA